MGSDLILLSPTADKFSHPLSFMSIIKGIENVDASTALMDRDESLLLLIVIETTY